MELKNKIVAKFPNSEKIESIADSDCPISQVHDHGWALVNYAIEKMKEAHAEKSKENT